MTGHYFISYARRDHGTDQIMNAVIDQNPIEWQTACHLACTLIFWQEITKEEFDMFKESKS